MTLQTGPFFTSGVFDELVLSLSFLKNLGKSLVKRKVWDIFDKNFVSSFGKKGPMTPG
jgi:hypothetical protein